MKNSSSILRRAYRAIRNPRRAIHNVRRRLGFVSPDNIVVPSLLEKRRIGGPCLVQVTNFWEATRGNNWQGNAGDWFLITVLRDLFEAQVGPLQWDSLHIHRLVNDEVVRYLNRSDGVVIGGGGMLLKDTNPNPYSDWQWSCPIDSLRKIRKPIAMFAVGYNRFRNQPDFAPVFREHLTLLAEKAVYLGVRNTGSVEAVRGYIPDSLRHKVRFQPCMTTLASRLYPERMPELDADKPRFAAFNCAFDRPQFRYGDRQEEILEAVAEAAWRVSRHLPIKYFCHGGAAVPDSTFLPYLERRGVPFGFISLSKASSAEILSAYADPHISIGMRGHTQLIAMGCQRPFVSLIAHPKLRFLLEDIDALDWGVDVRDPHLADVICAKVLDTLENYQAARQRVVVAQDQFWSVTLKNLADLARAFGLSMPEINESHRARYVEAVTG